MNRSAHFTLVCCLLFTAMFSGCGASAEKRLEGKWAFWHSAMMDWTEAQRQAVHEHNLERYSIVFNFNPAGVLKVEGAETGEGTWKVVKSSGDEATVELNFGENSETVDIEIIGDYALKFQRNGQDVPYYYTRPL